MTAPTPKSGKPTSELVLRLLSAIVLAAATIAALWAGGWIFAALAAVAAVLILREWMTMSGPFSFRAAPWALMAFVAVTVPPASTGAPSSAAKASICPNNARCAGAVSAE